MWLSLRLGTRSWHVWAWGELPDFKSGVGVGVEEHWCHSHRGLGTARPRDPNTGRGEGRRAEGEPALGASVLVSCGPPPAALALGVLNGQSTTLCGESLRGDFSWATEMPFLLLTHGRCWKSSNFPQHPRSFLHSFAPSFPPSLGRSACLVLTPRRRGEQR